MRFTLSLSASLLLLAGATACAQNPPKPPAALQGATGSARVTLPSGVVFESLQTGSGASPAATDTVRVHYRGTLQDGTEFDSSHRRGQPATFPLNQVIPCWTQGLQLMKPGGKAKLTCPPATAYGEQGRPPVIPPKSTLTFEVELIAIVK